MARMTWANVCFCMFVYAWKKNTLMSIGSDGNPHSVGASMDNQQELTQYKSNMTRQNWSASPHPHTHTSLGAVNKKQGCQKKKRGLSNGVSTRYRCFLFLLSFSPALASHLDQRIHIVFSLWDVSLQPPDLHDFTCVVSRKYMNISYLLKVGMMLWHKSWHWINREMAQEEWLMLGIPKQDIPSEKLT